MSKAHLSRVAALGCALCHHLGLGETPAEIHHIRLGHGMAQRADNWLTIGLCPPHHRGSQGIHGNRRAFYDAKATELDLLAETLKRIYG